MNLKKYLRLSLVFTAILFMALIAFASIDTYSPSSISASAQKSSDISGRWDSSIGVVYQITQQGRSFSWLDTKSNIKSTGTIGSGKLTAEWTEGRSKKSVTGQITKYDPSGWPIEIVWSNKVIFHRKAMAQAVTATTGWCCKDGDVFAATEAQCKKQGGRFFKTREEAEASCREKAQQQVPEPERGFCCLEGRIFPASIDECREHGGQFFHTVEEAEEHCRGDQPRKGWCCRDGDVFPATEPECHEHGGRFFHSREEAEEFCRHGEQEPERGYCCLDGRIFPSSIAECEEHRGRFFHTLEEAEEHCRGDHPPEGWCCRNGDIFPATEPQCHEEGGHFFHSREEAEEFCRHGEQEPERGFCCLGGEIFPASIEECEERRGRFFHTLEEAEEHCRGDHPPEGWCCREGEIFPANEAECHEHGGQFFPTREQAEEFCRHREQEPERGFCCLEGEIFPASIEECEERGGHFFRTLEEAEEHCRGDHPPEGWCCLDGKIYPVAEGCCEEFGGRFFRTREEAEEFCSDDQGKLMIPDLKGENWSNYVGQTVTIEGIFVRDPLPMLVTDLDIVRMNKRMPQGKYIILIGNNAQEINSRQFGGAKLKLTGVVSAIDNAEKYGYEYVGLTVISYDMIERLQPYAPETIPMKIPSEPEVLQEHRYAILFGGGIGPANNHKRYWNDLKFMYSTLISEYGYTSSTIAVLYANGKGEDKDMPVHYSATKTNLGKVFNLLEGITTTEDFIFLFTTNHGAGFYKNSLYPPVDPSGDFTGRLDTNGDEGKESLDEKKYNQDFNGDGKIKDKVSWDEELCAWKESIYDDDLASMLAKLKYDRMVIVMEQCFSGGFIPDLAGNNRIIISAAGEYEPSWCLPSKTYDEFSYYFTCAINGADPNGTTVDADTNNDGEVSMVEAFNYARSKDTQNETPWYEDSGDGIPHSGNMPKGGDGTIGGNTSLE